jgi:hypothetical protein
MIKLNRVGLLLNALMLAALVAAVAGPIHRFRPEWQPAAVVVATLLVAVEAGLLHHIFRRDHMWFDELVRYVVPELFVMLILMRVAATLSSGVASLAEDARVWLYDPLRIFDPLFVALILLGLLVGLFTHAAMRDMFELEPRASELPTSTVDGHQIAAISAGQDRTAALKRIGGRFIVGGILLLLALALEVVNVERLSEPGRPLSSLSTAAALLYLICGFLLYSQGRLALLRARWYLEGAHVADGVARSWTRVSTLLVAGVALAAAILPRAYGLGLLTTIMRSIGLLGYVIAIVGYFLTSLLSLLLILPILLLSLLTGGSTGDIQPPPPLIPPPAEPPAATFEPRLLTALIFWVCMLMLAVYALSIVVQRNPALVRALTTRGPLAWLLRRLGILWTDTRTWAGQVAELARAALQSNAAPHRARMPALRLGRLAPRELVRYFYRSTLRRAAEGGVPRRAGQTPYEYGATLGQQLPDAQADIDALTESFVLAEYSPRPIDAEDARRARRPWERVRRRLRGLARRVGQEETPG